MQKFGYKLVIATKGRAVWCKPYQHYKQYNQVLCIYYGDKIKQSYAGIELAFNDKFITQNDLDIMQIALNRAKKDLREYQDILLKELENLWLKLQKNKNKN